MKNVMQWVLAAVCLFTVGNVQVIASGEEEVKVSIPLITNGTLDGGEQRSLVDVPFTVYYQEGVIYIGTSAELSSITIIVENESTGQVWNATTDISDGMGEICIPNGGSGSYTVEVITEYGECFMGSFTLR